MDGLQFDGVSFSYEDRTILEDVAITIPKGEFALVVGPNGSGKTTFLRLASGLLAPSKGHIWLDGHSPAEMQALGQIHLVPQIYNKNAAQFPATVEEIIGLALPRELSKSEKRQRIEEALHLVDMEALAKRRIGHLSGGQQQRVMIGQALGRKPKYLFLDEPTSGIDFQASEKIFQVLRGLRGGDVTIIMVTHDIVEAAKAADTVACINHHVCYYGGCQGFLDTHMGTALSWHIGG